MFSKLKKLFKEARPSVEKPETPVETTPPVQPADAGSRSPVISKPQTKEPARNTPRSLSRVSRNRKGIRVFHKDQDLAALFPEDGILSDEPVDMPPVVSHPVKTLEKEKSPVKKTGRKTRQGFFILDGIADMDLFKDVAISDEHPGRPQEMRSGQEDATIVNGGGRGSTTRHGIPIIPNPGDDVSLVPEALREHEKREFLLLLNQNLGQKTRDVLMNEKGVRTGRKKPLTLKEMLKRYPLPQSQLDLHGFTALKAELRTESFLKNAYVNQIHTVIVIVGKGLHSDEGAVLPDVVENLLGRLRREGIILAYNWVNEKKSRSGAVSVYLNNLAIE